MRARLEETTHPDDAQTDYVSAAHLAPDSVAAQGGAGQFFVKIRHDPERAMQYYLAAYFLDPDFNDWEGVASRIREAAAEISQAKIAAAQSANRSVDALIEDPDPLVATAAMDAKRGDLSPRLVEILLSLSTSDCPDAREASIRLLTAHPGWAAGRTLDDMLKSADPWTRAAAVALVAATRRATAVEQLDPLLGDASVLVRFSAAVALLDRADGGRARVIKAMQADPNAWLRDFVAEQLTRESP